MTTKQSNGSFFFVTAFFTAVGNRLQLVQFSDPQSKDTQITIPRGMELSRDEMETHLKDGTVTIDLQDETTIPPPLLAYPKQLGCKTAAYVPILQEGQLRGVVLIGARDEQTIDEDVTNAFSRTIRLTTNSITIKSSATEPLNDRRASEVRALNTLASSATALRICILFMLSFMNMPAM
jgi:hypothetical protein